MAAGECEGGILSALDASKWIDYIKLILEGALKVFVPSIIRGFFVTPGGSFLRAPLSSNVRSLPLFLRSRGWWRRNAAR